MDALVDEVTVVATEGTQPTEAVDLGVLAAEAPAPELPADSFIDNYTPAAPVAPAEPKEVDPRVAWRKKNAEALKAKDAEEAATKKTFTTKAAEHLKKLQETRAKTLSARKETNRQSQKLSPDAGVPKEGSSWEKVNLLVNFTAGHHTKDVARFKTTLISLKAAKA